MRKEVAFALVTAIVLTLAACGGSKTVSDAQGGTVNIGEAQGAGNTAKAEPEYRLTKQVWDGETLDRVYYDNGLIKAQTDTIWDAGLYTTETYSYYDNGILKEYAQEYADPYSNLPKTMKIMCDEEGNFKTAECDPGNEEYNFTATVKGERKVLVEIYNQSKELEGTVEYNYNHDVTGLVLRELVNGGKTLVSKIEREYNAYGLVSRTNMWFDSGLGPEETERTFDYTFDSAGNPKFCISRSAGNSQEAEISSVLFYDDINKSQPGNTPVAIGEPEVIALLDQFAETVRKNNPDETLKCFYRPYVEAMQLCSSESDLLANLPYGNTLLKIDVKSIDPVDLSTREELSEIVEDEQAAWPFFQGFTVLEVEAELFLTENREWGQYTYFYIAVDSTGDYGIAIVPQ